MWPQNPKVTGTDVNWKPLPADSGSPVGHPSHPERQKNSKENEQKDAI